MWRYSKCLRFWGRGGVALRREGSPWLRSEAGIWIAGSRLDGTGRRRVLRMTPVLENVRGIITLWARSNPRAKCSRHRRLEAPVSKLLLEAGKCVRVASSGAGGIRIRVWPEDVIPHVPRVRLRWEWRATVQVFGSNGASQGYGSVAVSCLVSRDSLGVSVTIVLAPRLFIRTLYFNILGIIGSRGPIAGAGGIMDALISGRRVG